MNTFKTLRDIRRFVSDQPIDLSQYIDEDDLYDGVARDLLDYLEQNYNWFFGNELPNYSDKDFWNLFKRYEK